MSRRTAFAGIAGVMFALSLPVAWVFDQARVSAGAVASPVAATDPQIGAALHEVSAERIQQTIEKLVRFHTRHTLSSDVPVDSGKGIAAAAAWIQAEFQRYSAECGNCLEVKTDEFMQQPGP